MSFESLLENTCNLGTASSSQNYLGEWNYTYSYSTEDTKCRLVPIKYEEMRELQGAYDDVRYKIYFLSSCSVSAGDRLQINSNKYRVRDVHTDSSITYKVALVSIYE